MEENNIPQEESSIDFKKLFQDLLKHKKLYYKVLAVAAVMAVIYTLSLPNYYKVTVKLSPELSSKRSSTSSLASMASMFGVNLSAGAGGTEALFPTLYPDLMNSVTFHTTLFPITIHRDKEDSLMTYYDYLAKGQKAPWWSEAMSATTKAIGSLFSGGKKKKEPAKVDPFRLTQKQTAIVNSMKQRIVCDVDKKTMMITIEVTDQDPLICATLADSVQQRLQDFITDYRTKKARNDLEFCRKAYDEAQQRYEQARRRYASYTDANMRVFLETVRSEQSKLSQELMIQQQVYTQASAQLQQAELDVQKDTPAFAVLEPATVPVRKAGPARAKMCLIFLFLAFLGTTAYVLYKEDDLKQLLGMN